MNKSMVDVDVRKRRRRPKTLLSKEDMMAMTKV